MSVSPIPFVVRILAGTKQVPLNVNHVLIVGSNRKDVNFVAVFYVERSANWRVCATPSSRQSRG